MQPFGVPWRNPLVVGRLEVSKVDPTQAKRTNRILWLTLFASQLVYVALALSGAVQVRTEPLNLPVFPIALAIVAAVTAAASHFSWRRASGAGDPVHTPRPHPSASFTFYILAWVLDESIAIYGLVLALLAFSVGAWAPFSLTAFVLIILHRPS